MALLSENGEPGPGGGHRLAPMETALPLDHTACERARLARDARFDGVFFTAVRSTGIYCRPVCPAPAPKPSNVTYYPTAAAAAAAGYRPCLRCRPELAPEAQDALDNETLQRALALIHEGYLQDQPVADLAAHVGLSARQLQRLFVARLGAAPAQIHATRRLLLAKQLLTETALPVTDVAMASGYNSLRRFNAAFLDGCGMPPTAIRRQRGALTDGALTLRLGYRPPLDFTAMLGFLRRRAIPGIEQIGTDSYQRVIGPPERPSLLRVTADPRRPELLLHLGQVDPRAIPGIVRRVRRIFDLDADLRMVHATLAQEPLLATGIAQRPGLRVPGGWDGFEVAVRAVLGQQVSVAAAATLARRVVDRFGAMPDEVRQLLKLMAVKGLCRRANVEKVDAGPKGVIVGFRENKFSNPNGLVRLIQDPKYYAKVRPDMRVAFAREFDRPEDRLEGTREILRKLVAIGEKKKAA